MPLIVLPSLFTDGVTTLRGCYSCPNLAQLLLIQCLVRCRGINVQDFTRSDPRPPITRHKMVRFTAFHPICPLLKQTDDVEAVIYCQINNVGMHWNEAIIIALGESSRGGNREIFCPQKRPPRGQLPRSGENYKTLNQGCQMTNCP